MDSAEPAATLLKPRPGETAAGDSGVYPEAGAELSVMTQPMWSESIIRFGAPDAGVRAGLGTLLVQWGVGLVVGVIGIPILWSSASVIAPTGSLELFLNPPGDVRWVIQLLVGIAAGNFVGLWCGFQETLVEAKTLEVVRRTLGDETSLSGSRLQEALRKVPADSALVRTVQAVWNCRQMDGPDLLAATDAALEGASSRGKNIANYLMLLGLLGTVVGLSAVVGTLKPQFDAAKASGDVGGIISNLQGTITAMGTAFSATAYGIALAAITGYLAGFLASRRGRLLADIQGFAVAEIAPRVLPKSDAMLVGELRGLIEQGRDYLLQSVGEARDLLRQNKAFIDESQEFVAQVEAVINAATQNLHGALRDVGENYVVEAAKSLIQVAQELDRVLGETGPAIHNALRPLVVGAADLRAATESAESTFHGLKEPLERLVRQLESDARRKSGA